MKFNFHSDPSHGWVKVPKSLIKKLGIEDKISSFSYVKNDYVFLEEDCDLALFLDAMKKEGTKVEFREYHTDRNSKIRSYASYCLERV